MIISDSPSIQQALSVVIPTLGGETLTGTIEQLNRGTLVPAEILVCIPEEDAFRVKEILFPNVKVIKTNCRGQVAQRAIGFQHAQHAIVLQMDDDIFLQEDALRELTSELRRLGYGNALAPVYNDTVTGSCIHDRGDGVVGWLKSLHAYVVCGAPWGTKRMGVVTLSGFNYGVDDKYSGLEPLDVQWLPGGCVLHYKDDLIIESFYPFSGKAYGEDMIHSFLLKKRGIKLWVIPKAICTMALPVRGWNWSSLRSDYKARCYFLGLINGQFWRLRIWYVGAAVTMIISQSFKYFWQKNPPYADI
jgi:glycosyltransferase involved in cell wall biosynthesis